MKDRPSKAKPKKPAIGDTKGEATPAGELPTPAMGSMAPTQTPTKKRKPAFETLYPKAVMHTAGVGATIYNHQLKTVVPADLCADIGEFVGDTILEMAPRDPMERMLLMQAMWTHARLARLSTIANEQNGLQQVRIVNEAADRATNTFRKLMLALAEYRRPPRTESFTVVKQANVANQQVVANGEIQNAAKPVASNEVGSAPKALPPYTEGFGCAAAVRPAKQAVDVEYGAEDKGREDPRQPERPQTR